MALKNRKEIHIFKKMREPSIKFKLAIFSVKDTVYFRFTIRSHYCKIINGDFLHLNCKSRECFYLLPATILLDVTALLDV